MRGRTRRPNRAITKVIHLAETKLRKVIRSTPKNEKEVQDAFETLLIGADIPHSREADRIEYSSGASGFGVGPRGGIAWRHDTLGGGTARRHARHRTLPATAGAEHAVDGDPRRTEGEGAAGRGVGRACANSIYQRQLAESHLTGSLFGQIRARIERLAWHPT